MKRFYFIILILFVTDVAYSQWSTDPNDNLQVAAFGTNINAMPDGNGGAIFAFNNFDYEVVTTYLQAVDKYGYIKWNEPKIIADGPGPKNYVYDIFPNDDGSILMGFVSGYTYIDSNLSQHSRFNPYVQKIDSNGNKLWGEEGIRIKADTTSGAVSIDFCYDGDGGAFAFWMFAQETNYYPYYVDSLFIQHISKEGERLWGENGIFIDDSIESALNLWVIEDDSGGIYVQYRKKDIEYYIKKFDPFGNLNWTSSTSINYPIVIKDEQSGIIVSGRRSTSPRPLVINRITFEGEKLWGEDGIVIDDSVDNSPVALLFLNSNYTVSVFWDTGWWPNDDLFLQRYTLNGEQVWEEHLKVIDIISAKGRAGIVESENNSNIVIWGDSRNSGGLYAQRINGFGEKVWADSDRVLTYYTIWHDAIITDGNNGLIVVLAKDSPWGGLFAQQISKNGNLGEVITAVKEDEDIKPGNFYLAQNYPNPFNPSTTIRFSLPESGDIKLEVFNLLGEKVKTLVNEFYNAGNYEIEFDAENLPSGVYFYTIAAGNFRQTRKMLLLR